MHMNTVALCVVMSSHLQFHPVFAAGNPITPLVADPPVPTLILKALVPLLAVTLAPDPNPLEMVGAALLASRVDPIDNVVKAPVLGVVLPIGPGEANRAADTLAEQVMALA